MDCIDTTDLAHATRISALGQRLIENEETLALQDQKILELEQRLRDLQQESLRLETMTNKLEQLRKVIESKDTGCN